MSMQPWIDNDPLVGATLVISAEERERLIRLEHSGLISVRPVTLPAGRYLQGENRCLGWPVGALIGRTLLCVYHQTLRHFPHGPYLDDLSSDAIVVRSTDGGRTWSSPIDIRQFGVSANLTVLSFGNCFGVLNDTVFLATRYGLYKSRDEGATWSLIREALTQTQMGCFVSNPFGPRMVIHPDMGLVVASSLVDDPYLDMFSSQDEGATWRHERVELPSDIHPLEPTALYHDGHLIFLSRNHPLPRKKHGELATQRPCMMVSPTGWFPLQHQGISNISSFGWPDTTDVDFNARTGRYEAIVSNRNGGMGDHEDNGQNEQTVNLWSISKDDLHAGRCEAWRFECTLLRLRSGWLDKVSGIDGTHPGGAVIDEARQRQFVFVYCGRAATPTGIYVIARTTDTAKLRSW